MNPLVPPNQHNFVAFSDHLFDRHMIIWKSGNITRITLQNRTAEIIRNQVI
jgi:hypothetical protein